MASATRFNHPAVLVHALVLVLALVLTISYSRLKSTLSALVCVGISYGEHHGKDFTGISDSSLHLRVYGGPVIQYTVVHEWLQADYAAVPSVTT